MADETAASIPADENIRWERRDPFRVVPVQLAELDEDVRSEVVYDPGGLDLAEYPGESAEHPVGPDHGRQLVGRLDAVQERQHEGVLAEQRSHRGSDLRYLPRLHRHQHEIDGPMSAGSSVATGSGRCMSPSGL